MVNGTSRTHISLMITSVQTCVRILYTSLLQLVSMTVIQAIMFTVGTMQRQTTLTVTLHGVVTLRD